MVSCEFEFGIDPEKPSYIISQREPRLQTVKVNVYLIVQMECKGKMQKWVLILIEILEIKLQNT